MRKLNILATTAALLVAAAAPSFAASRTTHRAADAYASGAITTDRSGAYYYGPQNAQGSVTTEPFQAEPFQAAPFQHDRGVNLPYPDRPYGDPDSW